MGVFAVSLVLAESVAEVIIGVTLAGTAPVVTAGAYDWRGVSAAE